MKIISIGDLVLDYYYLNNKLKGVCGGMSSHNIIANISKFGLDTAVYGVCGNDLQGKIAIKSLNDLNIETNIDILENIKTRCFHVSICNDNNTYFVNSKKKCLKCGNKRWYNESKINCSKILNLINDDDILVFDNLNEKNQKIIDVTNNKKMLDLGQYFELENYTNEEIVLKLKNKFEIVNLNERVEKYIIKRFSLTKIKDINNLFNAKLIIITKGKNGSLFIYNNKLSLKKDKPAIEKDTTGAGDAFFAVYISEYIKNKFKIDDNFIDNTFIKSFKLTSKVVKKIGARGHIQGLYKIKKLNNNCLCNDFVIKNNCLQNVNNLEKNIIAAFDTDAYLKLKKINFDKLDNLYFIGTGGSYAPAKFASKLINCLYGTNTYAILPRDFYYKNIKKIDMLILFSYSGRTNDLLLGTSKIQNNKKFIITKGDNYKLENELGISKSNIISYKNNKKKDSGFLSFEGVIIPSCIFLKLYLDSENLNVLNFITDSIKYWEKYFKKYFEDNLDFLNIFLKKGSCFNIFTGDYTECSAIDLESKIIESGIYNCLIHEKKNFSHGRFINYENLSERKNIYLKSKSINNYEKELLQYLNSNLNIIIESRYDGILCEFDLLLAIQYFCSYISTFINIDISKPKYSKKALRLYYYK